MKVWFCFSKKNLGWMLDAKKHEYLREEESTFIGFEKIYVECH